MATWLFQGLSPFDDLRGSMDVSLRELDWHLRRLGLNAAPACLIYLSFVWLFIVFMGFRAWNWDVLGFRSHVMALLVFLAFTPAFGAVCGNWDEAQCSKMCLRMHEKSLFSRMRSEGFLFLSGGSGGGTVFVPISGLWPRPVRERPRTFVLCPMRCALRIGLEGGRLGGALWRCAVVIAQKSLVWVALCRCDCWGEPCHVMSRLVILSCRVMSRRVPLVRSLA